MTVRGNSAEVARLLTRPSIQRGSRLQISHVAKALPHMAEIAGQAVSPAPRRNSSNHIHSTPSLADPTLLIFIYRDNLSLSPQKCVSGQRRRLRTPAHRSESNHPISTPQPPIQPMTIRGALRISARHIVTRRFGINGARTLSESNGKSVPGTAERRSMDTLLRGMYLY